MSFGHKLSCSFISVPRHTLELHVGTSMWGPDVCHHYIVLGVILENTNIVELTGRILPELAPNLRSLGQRGAGGLATLLARALSLTSNLVSETNSDT